MISCSILFGRSSKLLSSSTDAKQAETCPAKTIEPIKVADFNDDGDKDKENEIKEQKTAPSELQSQSRKENSNTPINQRGGKADASNPPLVGDRIKVFWPEEKEWFKGSVTRVNAGGKCHINYDDGDTEWIQLAEQKWEILSPEGQAPQKLIPFCLVCAAK